MEPMSWALNDRTILKAWDNMRTKPSELPKKTLSEPVATQVILACCSRSVFRIWSKEKSGYIRKHGPLFIS
jgi:hypothetical protein